MGVVKTVHRVDLHTHGFVRVRATELDLAFVFFAHQPLDVSFGALPFLVMREPEAFDPGREKSLTMGQLSCSRRGG